MRIANTRLDRDGIYIPNAYSNVYDENDMVFFSIENDDLHLWDYSEYKPTTEEKLSYFALTRLNEVFATGFFKNTPADMGHMLYAIVKYRDKIYVQFIDNTLLKNSKIPGFKYIAKGKINTLAVIKLLHTFMKRIKQYDKLKKLEYESKYQNYDY